MATKKRTISVRLDDAAKRQVERAATLSKQSAGAFLGRAGEEEARRALLTWAVAQHGIGRASFSELAQDTGLAVEEIMGAMRLLVTRAKLYVEGSGAAATAALLAGKVQVAHGARVVAIVSGGNIDAERLFEVFE
ncbi:MAG: hypothetical protein AAB289_06990, partial [Chloroflexota bacterium]